MRYTWFQVGLMVGLLMATVLQAQPQPTETCESNLDSSRAAVVSLTRRLTEANDRITQLEAQLLKPQVEAQRKAAEAAVTAAQSKGDKK